MKSNAACAGSGKSRRAIPRSKAWWAWWNDTMASTRAALASIAREARVHARTLRAAARLEDGGMGKEQR
eukprot:6063136-Pleurochrysis_carterae.AAC.1